MIKSMYTKDFYSIYILSPYNPDLLIGMSTKINIFSRIYLLSCPSAK